ncbi:hypothetical protein TOT_020000897 [Theileria orientalis strain Shintoku]|uniref:Uncharacterized protein n=1 Tax=Theileria orientalis strain Shintoku TaxID=869250 RepID=J4C8E4_THEOR|nr:hypothetical protein TOT_020000897 [Theileria orientalis strain Shintoku]BAM40643.1 hypothetical protein TOT_020000897 [Theileria orientalis strain Shintoku]|eukprot:XP_009690944.1 hypothetical protein TOT_020000897 [Theileria orientalis strain Shintoku]
MSNSQRKYLKPGRKRLIGEQIHEFSGDSIKICSTLHLNHDPSLESSHCKDVTTNDPY